MRPTSVSSLRTARTVHASWWKFKTFSMTCEKGPWPMSCRSAAARAAARSSSSMRYFSPRRSSTRVIRWSAPKLCAKRECSAP